MVKSVVIPLTIADETASIASSAITVPDGRLIGVASTAGAMDDSDTYTVAITDKNSVTIYSVGSKAESTTTRDFGTTNLPVPIVGPVIVTITASATQNDAAVAFVVYLFIEL